MAATAAILHEDIVKTGENPKIFTYSEKVLGIHRETTPA